MTITAIILLDPYIFLHRLDGQSRSVPHPQHSDRGNGPSRCLLWKHQIKCERQIWEIHNKAIWDWLRKTSYLLSLPSRVTFYAEKSRGALWRERVSLWRITAVKRIHTKSDSGNHRSIDAGSSPFMLLLYCCYTYYIRDDISWLTINIVSDYFSLNQLTDVTLHLFNKRYDTKIWYIMVKMAK